MRAEIIPNEPDADNADEGKKTKNMRIKKRNGKVLNYKDIAKTQSIPLFYYFTKRHRHIFMLAVY